MEVASHLGLDRLILRGLRRLLVISSDHGVSNSKFEIDKEVSGRYTSRPVPLTIVETGAERTNPDLDARPVGCVPGGARSLVSDATSHIEGLIRLVRPM